MKYQAHTVGAVVLAFGFNHITRKIGIELNPIYLFAGAVLGELIPDNDHPKSMLGHAIQPVSTIIHETIGHRTFTHSILFIVITCILFSLFSLELGAGMGIGNH